MATVWRIVSPRYTSQILSGAGAAQYPGRWNHSGQQLIYTAATQSLAMLEKLVYMISPFPEMIMGAITIPNKYIEFLALAEDEAPDLLSRPPKIPGHRRRLDQQQPKHRPGSPLSPHPPRPTGRKNPTS